ncbi:Formin HOmology Domain [Aphelenchoides besseyi]|nr:Formin HOmology Domain [Aphelenchoides besseyi]KAI6207403.1 Formin HOmology Domain [Aphelenchoides besseyi]
MADDTIRCRLQFINDLDPFVSTCDRQPMIPLQYMMALNQPIGEQLPDIIRKLKAPHKSGDSQLQVSPSATGDLGSYLDSDLSLFEQPDELQILQADPLRSSLVLRQRPELRVKAIIEKLLYMTGRDQRRALFSLKQIFQDDKDLVHEFVQNEGLDCLIKLGRESDQTHQNHILRAIGQLMLYVDGMNGIIAHASTICWLYELLESPLYDPVELAEMSSHRQEWYRLVVKTALKLLLVFVEYTESNSLLLLAAVSKVEKSKGRQDWSSLMKILTDRKASDVETLTLGMTVVNKTLNGIPDQDTFFDVVDTMDNLGLDEALKSMVAFRDPQLTQQCTHYEHEVRKEDAAIQSDDSGDPQMVRMRANGNTTTTVIHKIHSDSAPAAPNGMMNGHALSQQNGLSNGADRRSVMRKRQQEAEEIRQKQHDALQQRRQSNQEQDDLFQSAQRLTNFRVNGVAKELTAAANAATPTIQNGNAEKWRRSPASELSNSGAEKRSETNNNNFLTISKEPSTQTVQSQTAASVSPKSLGESEKENIDDTDDGEDKPQPKAPPPSIPSNIFSPTEIKTMDFPEPPPLPKELEPEQLKKEPPTKKMESDEDEAVGGFAAMLQKRAKKFEGSQFRKNLLEVKQSESELRWKEAAEKCKDKPLVFNDIDFSSLAEFEQDPLVLVKAAQAAQDRNGGSIGFRGIGAPPPPPTNGIPPPPPLLKQNGAYNAMTASTTELKGGTLRMHWKPAQAEALTVVPQLAQKGNFWATVEAPQIDIANLTKLFEQKTKETPLKKVGGEAKPQVLQVLSLKRSQAINIGLTKLPPVSTIPPAIRKFDSTVLNKESIEKILSTMMPSLEEVERINEKQAENPDMPLGQAEQFMLSLSEIDCLLERLRLWLFMLDYPNMETDVSESLNELKNAMQEVEESQTFRQVMGVLLTIGNALNGTELKAFQLDFLARASEVKDSVHKYPLTYHAADLMINQVPDSTDLYSEFGAVSRCARLDFDAVQDNLKKMETDCKACFDYVAKISQKENNQSMKNKVNSYLTEVAERIHNLKRAHRHAFYKWNSFLLYIGYGLNEIKDLKPMIVFKTIIEFALEYRTNRDKIVQMRKRMAEKRERNKTRGMMINAAQKQVAGMSGETRRAPAVQQEMSDRERHQQMQKFLSTTGNEETLQRRRVGPTPERQLIAAQTEVMRRSPGEAETQEDELLDGVVRTVTAQADSRDQIRRRARQFNRKSLRRTRTIRQDNLVGVE